MDALGLPDPGDYAAPANGFQGRRPSQPAPPPVEATSEAGAPEPTPEPPPASQPEAEVTPWPQPAPTVSGVEVTESVYQQGPTSP